MNKTKILYVNGWSLRKIDSSGLFSDSKPGLDKTRTTHKTMFTIRVNRWSKPGNYLEIISKNI